MIFCGVMNRKRAFFKFYIFGLFSFVQSLPFSSNLELLQTKHFESEFCVYNDVIYPAGQNFTANPCETCICDPPKYTCTVKNCRLRVGCKAFHLANECCPEYICDCEKNGKKYANGEKVDEANPCKVCYCTGGEIKCNLVECYSRSDCEPIYVPGKCCPKYEHCPPLEQMRKNKSTDEPEMVEIVTDDVVNSTQHSSASFKVPTVATLEVFEIHPTDVSNFHQKEGAFAHSEDEVNVTVTVFDVTSAYDLVNGTEETGKDDETTTDTESATPFASLKDVEQACPTISGTGSD